jgi:hypothetical protein
VKPVLSGAVTPTPPAPGAPLKPAATVPAPVAKSDSKTGTTAVKTPPPKETARITVKPSLPSAAPRPVVAGAMAAGAGAAVVAAKAATPATPVAKKSDAAPIAGIPVFDDERSTKVTTALAGALMVLTWGTAVVLFLSYKHMI